MSRPVVVVQLSDPHVGAAWTGDDPAARLAAAVDRVVAMRPTPAAVLLTGDLAEHAADEEYARVRELLAPLAAPVHALPGNHDDRAALRRHFGLPGRGAEPIAYTAGVDGALRVVVLDTQRPGEDGGSLDPDRLGRLDRDLAAAPAVPALVAMHHPPFVTGIPAADAIGIPADERRALAAVIERHPQVLGLVAGHVHRAIAGLVAGRPAITAPSTYAQLRLDLRAEALEMTSAPAGLLVHALVDGALVTHVEPIA